MKTYAVPVLVWLVVIVSGAGIASWHEALTGQEHQSRTKADVMLDVVGEFRTVIARYLWFKMDLYHEELEDLEDAQEKQAEIMPLLRMVSLMDPTLTDAFDLMAWEMHKQFNQGEQALALLGEGLARNPDSFELHFRRALILYQMKRYEECLQDAQKATALAEDEFDQLNSLRLVYWTAKELGDRSSQRWSLDRLLGLRPDEQLWILEDRELRKVMKD